MGAKQADHFQLPHWQIDSQTERVIPFGNRNPKFPELSADHFLVISSDLFHLVKNEGGV